MADGQRDVVDILEHDQLVLAPTPAQRTLEVYDRVLSRLAAPAARRPAAGEASQAR